jgi:BON domain
MSTAGMEAWSLNGETAIRLSSTALEIAVRSDSDIERDVRKELKSRPDLDATDISVSVTDGVVTLSGFTHNYFDKYEAEMAALRVVGMLGVANDIVVRVRDRDRKPDPEIERDAVAAIKRELPYYWEDPGRREGWMGRPRRQA